MQRITLRKATEHDVPLIEPWYEGAARAVDGGVIPEGEPDLRGRFAEGGLWVIRRMDDPTPIGLLEGVVGWPKDGWVTIEFIALAAGHRGWGYGSEAVRMFEGKHRSARLLAQIDPKNGLALYFWLRLGYRPLHARDVLWREAGEDGIIAMVHDVTSR